jgi:hypothetical protein
MTPFWPDGQPIEVETDDLWTPLLITWEDKPHSVLIIVGRWRVDEEWWQHRIWREYFRLVTRSGLLIEIFHDLTAKEWYLQRIYD